MIERIERTIRYYGILRPPLDIKNIKWWRLTADIIKPPLSIYRNDRYLTPYGFWGYVQSMYADRVLQTWRMSYENEIISYNINTDLFIHQSVSCHLEAMLSSFVNLGLWVRPGFVFQRNNPIKEWVNLSMPIQEFRIKLLTEDTIYKFTYEYEAQENCEVPESSPPPPPPPPPPNKPNALPANTPNNQLPPISNAYDGNNDGGLTYKPEQGEPSEPTGEACTAYNVSYQYSYIQPGLVQEGLTGNALVFGVIGNIRAVNEPTFARIELECQGNVQNQCGAFAYIPITSTIGDPNTGPNNGYFNPVITSITPA